MRTPRAEDAGGVVAISLLDDAGGRRGDAAASWGRRGRPEDAAVS